jgi:hypothetical protein
MTKQQEDFLKIKKMIGRCSPQQLGQLLGQYYSRYLKENEPQVVRVENYSEALKIFDGTLFENFSVDTDNKSVILSS